MPERRFVEALKAARGATPHQYVLARRIGRARDLLGSSDLPLAEIAYVKRGKTDGEGDRGASGASKAPERRRGDL
ncbi:helix-turn-helix domain-containing protein, partial [Jannaschia aquimarina]|uniref:helix-turn-helix domain-containing protein n=1 Tax=Jannaschia aquimarina TaxID=935700 RepID=UPI000B702F39